MARRLPDFRREQDTRPAGGETQPETLTPVEGLTEMLYSGHDGPDVDDPQLTELIGELSRALTLVACGRVMTSSPTSAAASTKCDTTKSAS